MRRSIGYTKRRELAKSSVEVKLMESEAGKRISLSLASHSAFNRIPYSSRVKLRVFENHCSETVMFGTLEEVGDGVEPQELVNHEAFSAPSVQLRVVEADGEHRGLVLGSTRKWTLRTEGEDIAGNLNEGMLWLQSKDISNRIWKLEVRDDEQPIVYINSKIRNPYVWAKSDIGFASCVLPTVIREIFDEILLLLEHSDQQKQWADDWISWAESLLNAKFDRTAEDVDQKEWVDNLIDEFCKEHDLLNQLVRKLEGDGNK